VREEPSRLNDINQQRKNELGRSIMNVPSTKQEVEMDKYSLLRDHLQLVQALKTRDYDGRPRRQRGQHQSSVSMSKPVSFLMLPKTLVHF
jgi:hypothetical protein